MRSLPPRERSRNYFGLHLEVAKIRWFASPAVISSGSSIPLSPDEPPAHLRMHPMDLGRDASVVKPYVHGLTGESPLSVTQPMAESFAEISLPKALGSTSAHSLLSPYRHTGKGAKALLAFALALIGTLAAATFQSPVSGVGKSSLLPDSIAAELPYVWLVLGVWAFQGARGKMLELI